MAAYYSVFLQSDTDIPQNAPFVAFASGGVVLAARVRLNDATSDTENPVDGPRSVGSGASVHGSLTASAISGLTIGHQYRYRADGSNTGGTSSVNIGYYAGAKVIIFDGNGGSGGPGNTVVYWAIDSARTLFRIDIPSTVPTRPGYTFLGWAASSTATTARWTAGQTGETIDTDTLYAVWQRDVPPLKLKVGGAWKTASDVLVKVNGAWKPVITIKEKVGGTWKDAA